MTNKELTDLRRWAAEVCGKKIVDNSNGMPVIVVFDERRYWLPDENIAQAFEVLDAVVGDRYITVHRLSVKWSVGISTPLGALVRSHENRCLAILLACKAAWEASKKQESEVE